MKVTNAKVLVGGMELGSYTGEVRARTSISTKDITFLPRIPPALKRGDLLYTVMHVDAEQIPPLIYVMDPLSIGNKAKAQDKR